MKNQEGYRFSKGYRAIWQRWTMLVVLVGLSFAAGASAGFAQLGGGSIRGTVTDPTGAVIAGATVTATNVSTNSSVSVATTSAGYYVITPLNAGTYNLKVTSPGFESFTQENLAVDALQSRSVNAQLKLGAQAEAVVVTAEPPALDTEDATLGSTMDQQTYSALPILMNGNQRMATQFAYLTPGVQSNLTNGNTGFNSGIFDGGGTRGETAEIYVDGIALSYAADQGDPRTVWTSIPFDAVEQFQVQTSGYSADLQGQGIENYVIKGGTNNIHGTLFEFWRNSALDTWNFFSKAAINPATGKATKPVENQNEYGMTIGGPVLKNKLFLFGSYSEYRYSQTPNPGYVTIPTMAERSGNFTGAAQPIYDPTTTSTYSCGSSTCYTRSQFMGNGGTTPNVIPTNMISPIAQKWIATLPAPTNNALTNNYLGGNSTSLYNWTTADRIDWTINSKQHATVMYAMGRQATPTVTYAVLPLPYNGAFEYAPKTKTIALEHIYTFRSNLLNQLKYGYARYYAPAFDPQLDQPGWQASDFGITGLPAGEGASSFPKTAFSSNTPYTSWNTTGSYVQDYNTYTLVDNLQWTHGKHSFTFGAQIQWLQANYIHSTGGSSPISISYAQGQTGQYTANSTALTTNTGDAFASFMVGAVSSGSLTQYAHNITGLRYRPFSPYIQDNYKPFPNLTLNLGLRYDHFPPFQETNNVMSFMNPGLRNPLTGNNGALVFGGFGADSCQCKSPAQTYKWNVGPRLGASYQLNPKTVLHAAWGIMYSHGGGTGGSLAGPALLGYAATPSFVSTVSGFPAFYLNNSAAYGSLGLSNASLPAYTPAPDFDPTLGTFYTTLSKAPAASQTYYDPFLGSRAPEFENWNFSVQRAIFNPLTVSLAYVGSQGHFLSTTNNNARGYYANGLPLQYLALGSQLSNTATPTNIANAQKVIPGLALPYSSFNGTIAQMLLPFPQYSGVSDAFGDVANSNFNAFEVQAKLAVWRGLTGTINYTFSKSIDNGGTFRSGYLSQRVERTVSQSNQPQNLNATFVYHLPFGKGALSGGSRPVSWAIRDWNLSGIVTYSSGNPLAIVATGCRAPGQGTCMPNLAAGYSGTPRINGNWGHGITASNTSVAFVDKNAFTVPDAGYTAGNPYTIGNAPRIAPYNLYGPNNKDVDLSIRRSFPIHEEVKALFQADVTNLFNNVIFGGINTTVGNANFGTVSSQVNSSRDWQIVGKIEF
ncbi:MAG TPA: TonB-dependent receptor [Acidobacteriaceae bacterium]|nr:TonB-dependent receptor [Acidobacteriaceae bacterium]